MCLMEFRCTFFCSKSFRKFIIFNVILFLVLAQFTLGSELNCTSETEISRQIDNIGFHRNVYYNITLRTDCTVSNCKLCIQETIPPGLFVNKDQLNDLLRLDRLSATVDGDVDIEAPERESPYLIVKIYNELNSVGTNTFIANATLPVHLRYHDPQPGGGFRKFTLGQPEVYIHCTDVFLYHTEGTYLTPCAGNTKEPLPYRKIQYKMSGKDSKLVLEVPVGDTEIRGIVYAGTYGVAIAGSLYLAGVLYKI